MFTKMRSGFFPQLLTVFLAGSVLLSACSSAISTITLYKPVAASAPTAALEPTATMVPTVPSSDGSIRFTMDTGNLTNGFQIETVAAVPASANGPYWELLPEYTRVTLQGYPLSNHLMKPQIFIYPVNDLEKVNEGAGRIVASLQTLLQSPQEIPNMPFLPLFNAAQVSIRTFNTWTSGTARVCAT